MDCKLGIIMNLLIKNDNKKAKDIFLKDGKRKPYSPIAFFEEGEFKEDKKCTELEL